MQKLFVYAYFTINQYKIIVILVVIVHNKDSLTMSPDIQFERNTINKNIKNPIKLIYFIQIMEHVLIYIYEYKGNTTPHPFLVFINLIPQVVNSLIIFLRFQTLKKCQIY